ncbi:MAG: degA [Bacillota bacterium]|jgi:LacI family transcriptional regulator|nr:degA [Bacillota bacterium]
MAGVSYATVSRALNGSDEVNEKTRKRVLEICDSVGYSPNALARGLVTNSSNAIGLIIPNITNPFYPEVALGVEGEARARGYNVFLCNSNFEPERMESYFRILIERRVEGLIVASVPDAARGLFDFYRKKMPVVYIGSRPADEECNCVATDSVKGGYLAAEYLIKLGHRRIVFIGGTRTSNSQIDKLRGFRLAMEEHGLQPEVRLNINYQFNKRESGYDMAKVLINEKNPPTAIMGSNDMVALGALEACEEYGLDVPGDMSIIGFDDIPYASLPKIQLTTIAQAKYDLGKIAVDMLFKLKESGLKNNCMKEVLQPELVIRSSCREL